jgi:hypothetical protein
MRGLQGGRGELHFALLSMRGFLGRKVEVPLLLLFGVSGGQKVLEEFAHLFRVERDPLLAILMYWLVGDLGLMHKRTRGRL